MKWEIKWEESPCLRRTLSQALTEVSDRTVSEYDSFPKLTPIDKEAQQNLRRKNTNYDTKLHYWQMLESQKENTKNRKRKTYYIKKTTPKLPNRNNGHKKLTENIWKDQGQGDKEWEEENTI